MTGSDDSPLARVSTDWVVLLIDRSYSMESLVAPTVRGMNLFVYEQLPHPNTNLKVVLFSTDALGSLKLDTIVDSQIAADHDSRAITQAQYVPDGDTPLLAAMWTMIDRLENVVQPHDRALLVTMTDGLENASGPAYSLPALRKRIADKRALGNWVFGYLGAELDAWKTGDQYGVGATNALSWSPTREGVFGAFQQTSASASRWRAKKDEPKALGSGQSEPGFFPLQLPAPGHKP